MLTNTREIFAFFFAIEFTILSQMGLNGVIITIQRDGARVAMYGNNRLVCNLVAFICVHAETSITVGVTHTFVLGVE